uniref:Uncharacterized protein n=1 Tax=Anguilla anguilla TaxID=7936 RepID=A0A0E9RDG4_ANGAN
MSWYVVRETGFDELKACAALLNSSFLTPSGQAVTFKGLAFFQAVKRDGRQDASGH